MSGIEHPFVFQKASVAKNLKRVRLDQPPRFFVNADTLYLDDLKAQPGSLRLTIDRELPALIALRCRNDGTTTINASACRHSSPAPRDACHRSRAGYLRAAWPAYRSSG